MTDSFPVSPKFVDALPFPGIVHDGETVLYANPASAVLYRAATARELVGMRVDSLFRSNNVELCRARRRQFFEKLETPPAIDIELKALDGSAFRAELHIIAINWKDRRAALATLIDTTARARAIG